MNSSFTFAKFNNVFCNVEFHREVCVHPLEPGIFFFQLFHPFEFTGFHAIVLLAPLI